MYPTGGGQPSSGIGIALCRFLLDTWSSTWRSDDATFDQTAAAFDNPYFVDVVVHSYGCRIGAAAGDPDLKVIERRLSTEPQIAVPTIELERTDDGVDPPVEPSTIAPHFSDLRRHTVLDGGGTTCPRRRRTPSARPSLSS